MPGKKDPIKDSEFQSVLRHFVTTPHQPHKPFGKKANSQKKRAVSSKPKSAAPSA
jgi:hypothetical protein